MSIPEQERLIRRIESMRELAKKEYGRYWELYTLGRHDEADLKFIEWQRLNGKINHLKSLLNIENQKTDTIGKLHEAFNECWTADTSNIADEAWEDIDNSAGQQAATALVAQDILGGDIKRIRVAVGNTYVAHYINYLPNGMIVDFTARQFEANGVFINGPVRVQRDLILPTEAARSRYERLKKRVEAYMSND